MFAKQHRDGNACCVLHGQEHRGNDDELGQRFATRSQQPHEKALLSRFCGTVKRQRARSPHVADLVHAVTGMDTNVRTLLMLAVVIVAAVLFVVLQSDKKTAPAPHQEEHAVHWSYEPGTGPADWGAMDPAWNLCAEGRAQSPIDLTNAKTTELPHVELHLPSGREVEVLNQEGVIDALDNGHTIQVNTKTGERMTVGDKSYALMQCHLHSPGEHSVDGKHFPMEMHFVHQAENGALAVIAVWIEEGAENRVLAPLWKQLAEAPGTQATVQLPVKFADRIFTTRDSTGLFHYEGSLTTPPCSEGVQWFIRRTTTQLSKAQIAEFTAVYEHNNRPVHALNDRVCYLDETPDVTIR